MPDTVPYKNVTIESVDKAITSWFDKTVDSRVLFPDGSYKKVPIVFSQGERSVIGRVKGSIRDENGVLILPVISVRRTGIDFDASMTALGVQTDRIQIAKRVDTKSRDLQNLEGKKINGLSDPVVYDVFSIPFPDVRAGSYQIVVQTQYIEQMNGILQKIWRELDIQHSFVAPLDNDGRHGTRQGQFTDALPLDFPYIVGIFQGTASDSGNFEEFTEEERIVRYTTELRVPMVLMTEPEGEAPAVMTRRTAYKSSIGDERVTFVDNPADLDKIFGKPR
jgi:hypothetical protein